MIIYYFFQTLLLVLGIFVRPILFLFLLLVLFRKLTRLDWQCALEEATPGIPFELPKTKGIIHVGVGEATIQLQMYPGAIMQLERRENREGIQALDVSKLASKLCT